MSTSPPPRQPFGRATGGPGLWQRAPKMATLAANARDHDRGRGGRRNVPGLASAGGQDHHHLAAFESWLLLDLGEFRGIVLDAFEQFGAELLMRHFTTAKAQRHLDLVAFLKEALH